MFTFDWGEACPSVDIHLDVASEQEAIDKAWEIWETDLSDRDIPPEKRMPRPKDKSELSAVKVRLYS